MNTETQTYPSIRLFIGGEWVNSKEHLPIINPSNTNQIGKLPVVRQEQLNNAVSAAEEGFKIWSRTAPLERSRIILEASRLMRQRCEEIAQSISLELGKPIRQSRLEVIRGCEFFEWDAAEGQRLYGRVIPSAPHIRYLVVRQPIGCVASFSPWNFPMSQPARKIAGALASGCSVILKPAENTPAGSIHIARAFEDAGLPPGVLNLVFGQPADISEYLIPREEIRLVAFTGSTAVGRSLTMLASEHMTPVLMELGGHAPVIVCDDVDAQEVGVLSAIRKMRNSGQVCTSPTRFFVHERLYPDFVKSFLRQVRTMKVGDGLSEDTDIGPVAHYRRLEVLQGLVNDAIEWGGKLLAGGYRRIDKGYFFEPTVLSEVPSDSEIMQVEPFGPVAVINPVRSLEQGIELANSVPFGLAAYAFTHSAANVDQLINEVEAGNLSINTLEASVPETPFGGVKASGYGREGGDEGLLHYTIVKNVMHNIGT
ncbi:MAG: NAD-dependent succinate-semialdehyde dehydrogenase [Gammaproteobacteria bacterium]|nr:NAD-dependent succinate-semialdehyde dehydrogenase [Gammaproteobacteria bacterium]MCY4219195.1 NAD-dependent succinate-semialdehyde dehydrogenase [Gammaproteobacteria bacterium]MCY4274540.1 NAD-dependent succinate-semialdehyde dehydrogenase [Gammaproteobacteria bacterium]